MKEQIEKQDGTYFREDTTEHWKYNQLREEIIKAVPEIMRLEFGCKVKVKFDNLIYNIVDSAGEAHWNMIRYETNGKKKKKCIEDIDFKIIGRDITPIDILKTRKDLSIDGCGGIFIRNFCLNTSLNCNEKGDLWEMEYCGHYDIGIPLQDQSEPTINLLWDLIVKKGGEENVNRNNELSKV